MSDEFEMAVSGEIRSVEDLGRRIRARRRQAGLTQAELATFAGTSQPFVSQVERGRRTARLDGILRLTEALGLRLELVER